MDSNVGVHVAGVGVEPKSTSLLDGITVDAGPRRKLGEFFLAADAAMSKAGVSIRINEGFEFFRDAARSPSPFPPVFDPEESDIEAGFWLSAHDKAGEIVATHAARLITVGPEGLAEHMRQLRLHYRDPSRHLAAGTICLVDGPAEAIADKIVGPVSYGGGMWCRKDHRGNGMVHVLLKVVRYLALTRWNTQYAFSLFRSDIDKLGVLSKYRFASFTPRVALRKSYTGDVDLFLGCINRAMMEEDLERYPEWLGKMIRTAAVDDT